MEYAVARLVPIKTCLSLPEALVVSSYLRDHGIITALNGYHHASVARFVLFALNGIQISVLDNDLDQARELLADYSPMADNREQAETGGAFPTLSDIAVAVAALMLTGLPLPLWIRRRYVDQEHRDGRADARHLRSD